MHNRTRSFRGIVASLVIITISAITATADWTDYINPFSYFAPEAAVQNEATTLTEPAVFAGVTTNGGSGLAPTYLTLADAITALNAATITSPIVITANGSETAPAGGFNITATGTASNTIVIDGGAATTITAFSPQVTGSAASSFDAIFKIAGGDYITIQGFTMNENAGNTVTTPGTTNTMTEFGVLLVHASATDGAQNNTIQNNAITLSATYTNSVGIFSTSSSSTANASQDATSTAGTNSNNKIYGNTISNVAQGILFICPPVTATVFETGNDVGGTALATGNTITFGNATASSGPWNRSQSTVQAGIYYRNGAGFNARFNSVTSTSFAYVGSGGLNGIMVSSSAAPTGVTYTTTISNNTVNITSTGVALLTGIDFGHGISTGTIAGSNNNVTVNQTSGAANSAVSIGIKANYASASVTANTNTVVMNSSQSSGAMSGGITGITTAGVSSSTNSVSSNNVTINESTSATGTMSSPTTGITAAASATTSITADSNSITLNVSAVGGAVNGSQTALNVGGATATNNVRLNTVLFDQTTSIASGITTGAITGISATAAATTLNIGGTSNANTITAKQAVTGAGTYGNNPVTYVNATATHGTVNVKNNSFLTTGSTLRSTGNVIGVFQDATVTVHVDIQNNLMSVDRVALSGFITFQSTSGTPSEVKDTISNNTITFTSLAGVSTSTGISSLGGPSSPALNNKTIDGNTISITGTHTGTTIGITAAFTNTGFIRNNSITISCASPTVNTITSSGTAMTVSGNTINVNSSTTSPTAMQGINLSSTGAHSVTNNTFTALNFTGIITGSPVVSGIALSGGTIASVFGNTITNISIGAATSSGSPIVDGILISGGSGVNAFKNKIHGITSAASGVSTVVSGIRISAGGGTNPNNIYNNLIGNLTAPAATSSATIPDSLRGINITSTTTSTTHNVYYNSVYLNATSTGANFGSSGVFHATGTISTTSTLNLRNNNIVNLSTPTGVGATTAFTRSIGGPNTLNNYGSTSNNNNFYAGSGANRFIYNDNVTPYTTVAAYKAATIGGQPLAPRDSASFSENPTFLSTTGSNANFLHIDPTVSTQLESGAVNIGGITDDYDAQTRQGNAGYGGTGTAPDIGADEFNGIGIDLAPPTVTYTALGNTASPLNRTLTTTITDATGVPTAGAGLPVLYWRINAGAYTAVTANYISGSTYEFTFGAGAVSPDTVSYYIVAQDTAGTPNVGSTPAGGSGFTINPPAASTPPASPSTYTIIPSIGGTFTVGSTGTYATLTAAIAAVNAAEITAPVTLSLTDASYTTPAEVFPLTINANSGSSTTNTVTIRPTLANTTITGSSTGCIFSVNGADYVTIDGSNGGGVPLGTSRDLTITNTNTGTSSAVVCLQTAAGSNGATNNTVKNVNVVGNSNTTTLFGVFSGATGTPSTTSLGTGNNSNTIQNNNISKTQYGIYSQGASSASKNTGNVITQNLMNSTSPNNLGVGGIIVGFENNLQITQNNIANIVRTGSPDGLGISVGFGTGILNTSTTGNEVTNATIASNFINNVTNSGTFSAAGIAMAQAASGTNQIANNSITSVGANGTGGDFGAGIFVSGGAGATQIYYNSISMTTVAGTGTGSSSTERGYALAITGSNPTMDVRNNVFYNTQAITSQTTFNYALGLGYSTFTNLTSNYNDFFVGGTNVLARTGNIDDGGTDQITLLALQTATSSNANSIDLNPSFNNPANNLQPQTGSPLLLAGTPVGVATDILAVNRSLTTPTLGAYENATDTSGPTITYTPLADTSSTSTRTLSVTITDPSGVASGGLAPRIYQRRTPPGGSYSSVNCTGSSPTYSCDIDSGIIGPFAPGNSVQYFIVAQDTLGYVSVSPSGGAAATDVNTVTTPPTTPSSYDVTGIQFCNTAPIAIADGVSNTSTINVSSLSGTINTVKVKLNNLSHTFGSDIDILLVGPNGEKYVILSDALGSTTTSNATITLADSAAGLVPTSALSTGSYSYRPTNYTSGDTFAAPAPTGPYQEAASAGSATFTSVFAGANPNGNWSVYVYDDGTGDTGSFAGGWCLEFTLTPPSPGTVQFSPSSYTPNENSVQTITATRTGGVAGVVSVDYATGGGTATAGTCGTDDYVSASGTLSWADGESGAKTFNVTICPDAVSDPGETIDLTLSNPTGGVTIGGTNPGLITITDVPPPLAGTYSVPGDYPSLTNPGGIFEAINNSGTTGLVTINITADLTGETGVVALNQIASGFGVIVQPSGAARTIEGSNTTGLINMNGADNVVFTGAPFGSTGLTIRNTSATTGSVFRYLNDASTNGIESCLIELNNPNSTAILYSTGTTTGNDDNSVNGSTVRGTSSSVVPFNSIASVGTSAAISNGFLNITNNTLTDFEQAAVLIDTGNNNATVAGNDISQTASRTNQIFGIFVGAVTGTQVISSNKIHGLTSGGTSAVRGMAIGNTTASISENRIYDIQTTAPATGLIIGIDFGGASGGTPAVTLVNNFVSIAPTVASAQVIMGIRDYGYGGNLFTADHNSIYIGGTGSGSSSSWALVRGDLAPTTFTARNNIAFNNRTGGTGNHFAGGDQSAATGTFVSNGNFYAGTGTTPANFMDYGTSSTGTPVSFATYQTGPPAREAASSGNVASSYTVSDIFVNAATGDLHLKASAGVEILSAGITLGSVTNDIDLDPRPATNPDKGADELVQAEGGVMPSGTYYNAALGTGDSLGGNVTITGTMSFTGIVTETTDTLTFDCNAAATGASSTAYFDGTVRKNYCSTGTFSYPVGQGGYSPVDVNITALATNPSSLTVTPYDATLAGFDLAQSLSRNWDLTETGNLTADLQFRYVDSDVNGNEAAYRAWRVESNSTITNMCGCVDDINNILGPVTGVTTFSRWTGAGPLAPTAAEVSLAGRVTTADGRGIRNAVMVLSGNSLTQPMRVVTGSFGYYKFDGLEAGETYVVTVNSKRFMFSVPSRVVNLPDSITDLDFFALPQE